MYGSNSAECTISLRGFSASGDETKATWSATLMQKGINRKSGRKPDWDFLSERNTLPYLQI